MHPLLVSQPSRGEGCRFGPIPDRIKLPPETPSTTGRLGIRSNDLSSEPIAAVDPRPTGCRASTQSARCPPPREAPNTHPPSPSRESRRSEAQTGCPAGEAGCLGAMGGEAVRDTILPIRRSPGIHCNRYSPGVHCSPSAPKNVAHLVGGSPKRWARQSPPVGWPICPGWEPLAMDPAAVGTEQGQCRGCRRIEHPLKGQAATTASGRGHPSIPFCNDLQQQGKGRCHRPFHICSLLKPGEPHGERSLAPPAQLPQGNEQ